MTRLLGDLCWAALGAVLAVGAVMVTLSYAIYGATGSLGIVHLAGRELGIVTVDVLFWPLFILMLGAIVALPVIGLALLIRRRR